MCRFLHSKLNKIDVKYPISCEGELLSKVQRVTDHDVRYEKVK